MNKQVGAKMAWGSHVGLAEALMDSEPKPLGEPYSQEESFRWEPSEREAWHGQVGLTAP